MARGRGWRIIGRIFLRDETEQGQRQAEQRLEAMFSRLTTAATAVGAALVAGIEAAGESARREADALRALEIAGGGGTPAQREALAGIVEQTGLGGVDAAAGALFAVRQGFTGEDAVAAGSVFADVASRGVAPDDFTRSLNVFGVSSPGEVGYFATAAQAAASEANVELSELLGEFRDSGTTFRTLGLDRYQALGLQAQAYRAGTVSETQSFLERSNVAAAQAGIDPLTLFASILEATRGADPLDALSLLEPLGGDNLVAAFTEGRFDLSELGVTVPGYQTGVIGTPTLSGRGQVEAAALARDIRGQRGLNIATDAFPAAAGAVLGGGIGGAAGGALGAFGLDQLIDINQIAGLTVGGATPQPGTVQGFGAPIIIVQGSLITEAQLPQIIGAGPARAGPGTYAIYE